LSPLEYANHSDRSGHFLLASVACLDWYRWHI